MKRMGGSYRIEGGGKPELVERTRRISETPPAAASQNGGEPAPAPAAPSPKSDKAPAADAAAGTAPAQPKE